MSITLNTYGIKSINTETFNMNEDGLNFPRSLRVLIEDAPFKAEIGRTSLSKVILLPYLIRIRII